MKLKKQKIKNYVDRYNYYIEWSEEGICFTGKVTEYPSLCAHGNTGEKALKEIKFVVTKVVKSLLKNKEHVPICLSLIDSEKINKQEFREIEGYKAPKPNKKKR